MAFTIKLSLRAYDEIDAIVDRIQRNSPVDATRWRRRLFDKLETLRLFPRGCSLAPEDSYCSFEVRQTIFGNYRILFTISDESSRVDILTVRWAARRMMSSDDLSQAASDDVDDSQGDV